MEAQKAPPFSPEQFGVIVESGRGDPSPEVRYKMQTEYGFNHESMLVIPDSDRAHELVATLGSADNPLLLGGINPAVAGDSD
jgi:hypothetical protein